MVLVVKELRDRPLPKADAARVFEVEPPKPKLDPIERILRRRPVHREPGAGRPTKRERRDMDRWRSRERDQRYTLLCVIRHTMVG